MTSLIRTRFVLQVKKNGEDYTSETIWCYLFNFTSHGEGVMSSWYDMFVPLCNMVDRRMWEVASESKGAKQASVITHEENNRTCK